MRVAVVSDIHSNLHALEAVLAAIDREAPDELWCLGDLVGYGPRPNECCATVGERAHVCLAGNHDLAVRGTIDLEEFHGEAGLAATWTREVLEPEWKELLDGLEPEGSAHGVALYHGSARDPIWEYVFNSAQADATLRLATTTHCCNGHTHVPVVYREGEYAPRAAPALDVPIALTGRCLVNPGSAGQPRDGDARASYALLDSDGATVTFRRAPYDVHETQRRIRARGLPPFLADRLALGY